MYQTQLLQNNSPILQFILLASFYLTGFHFSFAQTPSLNYYLTDNTAAPDQEVTYNASIPTPESVLGYQIGEWHLTHDQLVFYLRQLAASSDRISLTEFGRTYEDRPLLYLTITSPANHERLENIRQQHLALTDPEKSSNLDISDMPTVLYQGFSIHGNEASGSNAAPVVAYFLAAAEGPEIERILEESIILLDPCYNPDGFNRFASWVNTHKSQTLVSDPQSREFDEAWPGGRTNHYWFDLNRDWLPVQHPESQGRLYNFHHWKPNVLTDHHEMGTNATFFFQPGVPQRTNPITPPRNQQLTEMIGRYHAQALDQIASLYYSKENFDDYYYGKGSTYPDVNGAVGILFEQASSRGHLQESVNGPLSFSFTIRNQVRTALSSIRATVELREELLNFQRDFYSTALEAASKHPVKAYVFDAPGDPQRLYKFLELLSYHEINVYTTTRKVTAEGATFEAGTYIIPLNQPQHRLIRAMFERPTEFQDSLFYDVSAFTLPLAFNLRHSGLPAGQFSENILSEMAVDLKQLPSIYQQPTIEILGNTGYIFDWQHYHAPALLYHLQDQGLKTKVLTEPFQMDGKGLRTYPEGSIFIPTQYQPMEVEELNKVLLKAAEQFDIPIEPINSAENNDSYLGSPTVLSLKKPKVLMLVGNGVRSYDAGEIWHLLDQRYQLPLSMIEEAQLHQANLSPYQVIILPEGSHYELNGAAVQQLKDWVKEGGVLIAIQGGARWAATQQLSHVTLKKNEEEERDPPRRPYHKSGQDRGAQVIGGAIFNTRIDLSHPLCYGYNREELPVFHRGTNFFETTTNPYATPMLYTEEPLLAGYISKENLELLKGSAGIVVSSYGNGRVINFAQNPNFRAFWLGTDKLMANAIFFGQLINGSTTERAPKRSQEKKEKK